MKKFKNKADKFAYLVRLIVPILVPVVLFLITISTGKLYWTAGIMLILVIFAFALKMAGVGNPIDNK